MQRLMGVVVVGAAAAAAAWWLAGREAPDLRRVDSVPAAIELPAVEVAPASEQGVHVGPSTAPSASPTAVPEIIAPLTQAGLDQLGPFQEARGYGRSSMRVDASGELVGQEIADPYEAYDLAQLRSLAAQGDPWAMQLLVDRILGKQKRNLTDAEFQEVTGLLLAASVRGYTSTLLKLSEVANDRAHSKAARADPALKTAQQQDQFAYIMVALRRGDLSAPSYRQVMGEVVALQGARAGNGFDAGAQQRADEIYAELEAERRELGLGGFDNQIPPLVRETQDVIHAMYVAPIAKALKQSADAAAARRAERKAREGG